MSDRAVPPSYRAPAKPRAHRHGKATANAQTGVVKVIGAGTDPIGATTISREAVAAFKGKQRRQTATRDAGDRGADRRGGAYQDGTDKRRSK